MSNNKVVKSVSFNKSNEEEKMILDAVRRRNFSKYAKKLMLEDIKKKQSKNKEEVEPPTPKPLSVTEQLSQLKRKG